MSIQRNPSVGNSSHAIYAEYWGVTIILHIHYLFTVEQNNLSVLLQRSGAMKRD